MPVRGNSPLCATATDADESFKIPIRGAAPFLVRDESLRHTGIRDEHDFDTTTAGCAGAAVTLGSGRNLTAIFVRRNYGN